MNSRPECLIIVNENDFRVTTNDGEYRFRLKAKNGQIIAASKGYKKKSGCLNGIESIRKNAPGSTVEKEE